LKKQADKIKRIGLIGNSDKAACAAIIRKAARLIQRAGRKAVVGSDAAALAREVDLLLVFGGDGTMLRAAREIAGSPRPFSASTSAASVFSPPCRPANWPRAEMQIWSGEFKFESRALIEVSGICNGKKISRDGVERHRHQPRRGLAAHRARRGRGRRTHHALPLRRAHHQFADRLDGVFAGGGRRGGFADGGGFCADADLSARAFEPLHHFAAVLQNFREGRQPAAGDHFERGRAGRGGTGRGRRSDHPPQPPQAIRLMHLADSSFLEALRHKLQWRGALSLK
jgi:hypothetical protein